MKTEQKLQEGIKFLASQYPLDEITVILLCSHLNIKRQTFYYHYKDIYDLIDSIFMDESHKIVSNNQTRDDIINELVHYIEEEYKFLSIISKSNANDILQAFFYDVIYYQIINEMSSYNISNDKKGLIARFITNSLSNELVYRIYNNNIFDKNLFESIFKFFYKNLEDNIKG
mgnify:CR=1 FL=1